MSEALGLRRTSRVPAPAPSGHAAAVIGGVTVRLGGTTVLCDVDLDVHTGEVVALVGPNGAGKSTLLSVLAGDLRPDAGSVVVDGRPVGDWTAVELAMRRAVLLQSVSMSFPFTVHQAVAMGRTPWVGQNAEDDDERLVRAAMADTDVTHLADRVFTSLSGGERARAALARVIAQDAGGGAVRRSRRGHGGVRPGGPAGHHGTPHHGTGHHPDGEQRRVRVDGQP